MLTYDELPRLTEGGGRVQSLNEIMDAAPGSSFHHITTSARYMRDAEGWIRWDRSNQDGERRDREALRRNVTLPREYVWDVHITESRAEVPIISRESLPPIDWDGTQVVDLDEVMDALPGSCFHHDNDRDGNTFRYYRDEQGWVRYGYMDIGPQRRTREQLASHGVGSGNYYWDVHVTTDMLDQQPVVDYSTVTTDNMATAPVGAEFVHESNASISYRKQQDGSWNRTDAGGTSRPVDNVTIQRRVNSASNTYHWRMTTINQSEGTTFTIGQMVGRRELVALPVGAGVTTHMGNEYVKQADGTMTFDGRNYSQMHFTTTPEYRISTLPGAEQVEAEQDGAEQDGAESVVSALTPGHQSPTLGEVASLPLGSAITGRGNWEREDWLNNHFIKREAGWCHVTRTSEDRANHPNSSLTGDFWTVTRIGPVQEPEEAEVPAEAMPYIRAGEALPERWAHELMTAMPVGAVCSISGSEFEKREDGGWARPGSDHVAVQPSYDGTRRDGWQLVSLPIATREEIVAAAPGAVVHRTHNGSGREEFCRLRKQDNRRWNDIEGGANYARLSSTCTYYWERKIVTDTTTNTNTNTLSVGDYLRQRNHAIDLPVGSQVRANSGAVYTKTRLPNFWLREGTLTDFNGMDFNIARDYNRVIRVGPDTPAENTVNLPAVGTNMTIALADELPVGAVLRWHTGREWVRRNADRTWSHQEAYDEPVFDESVGQVRPDPWVTTSNIPCLDRSARDSGWTYHSVQPMPGAPVQVVVPALVVGSSITSLDHLNALPVGAVVRSETGREYVKDSTGWARRPDGARMAAHRFSLRGGNVVASLPVNLAGFTIGQQVTRSQADELPIGTVLAYSVRGGEQEPGAEQLTKEATGGWAHAARLGREPHNHYREACLIPAINENANEDRRGWAEWRLKSLPLPHQQEIQDLIRRIIQGTESSGDGYAAAREGGLLRVGVRPMPKHGDKIRFGSIFGLPAGSVVTGVARGNAAQWGVYTWDGGDDVELTRVAGTAESRFEQDQELTVIGVGQHTPPVYETGRELLRAVFAEQRRLHDRHSWCGQEVNDLRRAGIWEEMPLASDRVPEPPAPASALAAPVVGERVSFPVDTERVRALPVGSTLMSDSGIAYIRTGQRDLVRSTNLRPLIGDWGGAAPMVVAFVAPSREAELSDAF